MLDLSLPTWVADAHSKSATPMDRYYGFGEVSTCGGSCEGDALPVVMSIAGARNPHDYRDYNLWVPGTT